MIIFVVSIASCYFVMYYHPLVTYKFRVLFYLGFGFLGFCQVTHFFST